MLIRRIPTNRKLTIFQVCINRNTYTNLICMKDEEKIKSKVVIKHYKSCLAFFRCAFNRCKTPIRELTDSHNVHTLLISINLLFNANQLLEMMTSILHYSYIKSLCY